MSKDSRWSRQNFSDLFINATVFVCLDTHCTWTINQEKPENRHLASCSRYFNKWHLVVTGSTNQRKSSVLELWTLENVISASFGANISKILLELPWRVLRFAVYTGSDRYRKLVLCLSLVFSLTNANFTHYCSSRKLCHKTSERHHKEGCASIWACMSIQTNTVSIQPRWQL